jgi:hypothetical protein
MHSTRWTSFCLFSICLVSMMSINAFNNSDFVLNYPGPNTVNNKLMGLLLSYDLCHIDPLILIVNEYTSMCEGGWNATMVLFTTADWTPKLRRYMKYKSYCYRIQNFIDIRYELYDKNVSINLGSFHRKYIEKVIDNYDMFIYHEDDIVIKHTHIAAYLYDTKKLHYSNPEKSMLYDHTIGFQRYRLLAQGIYLCIYVYIQICIYIHVYIYIGC